MTTTPHATPEEQFALLLDGELREEDVNEQLRSLLSLARSVEEHAVVPAAEHGFRDELRAQLIAQAGQGPASLLARARDAVWIRTANLRHSLRTAAASGVAASLIGTAGVAAAAQHALPGELLYPIKEATESVRLALAGDLAASGRLHLRFAEERLEEVTEGAQTLRAQLLIDTLREMDDESIAGAEDLLGWATRTGDEAVLDDLRTFVADQRDGLLALRDRLPSAVVPVVEDSLEVLRRIEVEIDGEPAPCDCPEPANVSAPALQPQEPGGVAISRPGESPAGAPPRPCTCTPGTDAPPTVPPPSTGSPEEPPADEDPEEPQDPAAGEDPVDLVPELPGPLDGVGDVVDDTINDVIETTDPITEPLPVDPSEDVIAPVDETIDDLLGDAPSPTPSPSLP